MMPSSGSQANRRTHSSDRANGQASGGGESQSFLENENNRLVDDLSGKVSALKSLTIQIGDEVREHNRFIGDMHGDFEASGGLLGTTMKRLGIISKSGGGRFMCYLIAFAFAVFLVIYWLVSR